MDSKGHIWIILLVAVLAYFLVIKEREPAKTGTSAPSGSTAGGQVGSSLDSLVNSFARLFTSVKEAVNGSASSDATNTPDTSI